MDPISTFRTEAKEHLDALEQALLDLEQEPDNTEQIAAAFRAMHTIKGSAGMVGFEHLSDFTHHLESLFESVRNGKIALTPALCQWVFQAADHIGDLLQDTTPSTDLVLVSKTILEKLTDVIPVTTESSEQTAVTEESFHESLQFYRIDIQPHAGSFCEGLDIFPVLRELNELGECHTSSFISEHFTPDDFDPETCYLRLEIHLLTRKNKEAISDVFLFVNEDWSVQIVKTALEEAHRLGFFVAPIDTLEVELISGTPQTQVQNGESISDADLSNPKPVQRLPTGQKNSRNQANSEEQSIRVPQHKLDALMDQVGELVILQASLDQLALSSDSDRLAELAEELSRLSNGLRDIAFDIRMLPIGSTFSRFRRLIRDLSHELGKNISLETSGAETELDKVVLDKLADPLVHMLRNSLDHGIEVPEQRRLAGKPEKGVISLSASHFQGQILIEITDDGKGLDAEKILVKATERGLIEKDAKLEEEEIYALIFAPGFSTADKVSDVSGRGVGMDVVRSAIDSLQGQIHIESVLGKGTRFRILLPMTLSIIDGLMVSVSEQRFIVPLNMVEECIETIETEDPPRSDTCLMEHRGRLVPRLRLREKFNLPGARPAIEQTVIVRVGDEAIGITVDEVIGNHQTVIRNLGRLYRDIPGVMGATILGDGGIAMILDLLSLAVIARKRDMNN